MFWLRMNITSSKVVNIGKLNITSPLLRQRVSKSSFEASGLRISSHGGNTCIYALALSINYSYLREENREVPQLGILKMTDRVRMA